MNIKVAAFTVSEKSNNNSIILPFFLSWKCSLLFMSGAYFLNEHQNTITMEENHMNQKLAAPSLIWVDGFCNIC